MKGLTFTDFVRHMDAEGVLVEDKVVGTHPDKGLQSIVIRGEDGDYHLAAIHTKDNTLIIDLGVKVEP